MNNLINFYNTNKYFHSFATAVEYAIVSFIVGYSGSFPKTKEEWTGLAAAGAGAVFGGIRGWLQANVIAKNLAAK